MNGAELNIAEIPFDSGSIQYRYSRYLADDGQQWIRHGRFTAFPENGQLASEGNYENGVEHGGWCDFNENGQLAAEGTYVKGAEANDWKYYDI